MAASAAGTVVLYLEAEEERHREGVQGEDDDRSKLTKRTAVESSLRLKGMRWRAVVAEAEQSGERRVDAMMFLSF
jgi:hypothetical protein